MGRLTKAPDIRTTSGNKPTTVARYTLAVNRNYKTQDGQQSADFVPCLAFGRNAEFAEKYLNQGTKICVRGRIQTGSYTNREGNRVFTTEVVVDEQEFCESKATQQAQTQQPTQPQAQAPAPQPQAYQQPAPQPTYQQPVQQQAPPQQAQPVQPQHNYQQNPQPQPTPQQQSYNQVQADINAQPFMSIPDNVEDFVPFV